VDGGACHRIVGRRVFLQRRVSWRSVYGAASSQGAMSGGHRDGQASKVPASSPPTRRELKRSLWSCAALSAPNTAGVEAPLQTPGQALNRGSEQSGSSQAGAEPPSTRARVDAKPPQDSTRRAPRWGWGPFEPSQENRAKKAEASLRGQSRHTHRQVSGAQLPAAILGALPIILQVKS
jgi:hypothetical protein